MHIRNDSETDIDETITDADYRRGEPFARRPRNPASVPVCQQCREELTFDRGFPGNREEPPEPAYIYCDNDNCKNDDDLDENYPGVGVYLEYLSGDLSY